MFGLIGAVGLLRLADRIWSGAPYPVADPAATAQRLDRHTQAVYDVLGLPNAELKSGYGNDGNGYGCHYRGLRNLFKQLPSTPPSVPGVVDVSNEWAVKGNSTAEVQAALRRARKALNAQGWQVTRYSRIKDMIDLVVRPPGSVDSVRISTYPRGLLTVSAYAACARYPSGTLLDDLGMPKLPAQRAPTQLRG
ncbi:hypothetical protein SGFS_051020 [Streptomyces graminofaciens]|uniref:Lipoprotein n=1 Tax=Streptomyces graminofaciens TaxID=68212 RepID=A0ABN5VN17_9ACTN|nr:hypothetical protein [Streptomyces graminofaciens]BBC33808.1 hypothetical protein SGFS_051020 [Streptomyces graminofaciens]